MISTVQKFIVENNLLTPRSKVIVGVSGGVDSVLLLNVLHKLGYDCVVAHCNFGLRGEESGRDEMFVEKLAANLNRPYYKIKFDTNNYANEKSISIEMAARDLRYNWFEQLRADLNAEAIAVAHHSDDVVETFLMNLVRGSGIRGLTGIKAQRDKIVRPLLCVSRAEIETFVEEQKITYVVDSTNLENVYTRNQFRNKILPLLEEINPSLRKTILTEISLLKEVEQLYDLKIADYKSELLLQDEDLIKIDINKLKQCKSIRSVLYEIFIEYGFSSDSIVDIEKLLNAQPGKYICSRTHQVVKDRDFLLLYKIESLQNEEYLISAENVELDLPLKLKFSHEDINDKFDLIRSSEIAYLDWDKLAFPLKLRHWRSGDSFNPLGMRGRKKLSDYFVDLKLSIKEKEAVWVLETEGRIIWVVGYRIDSSFAITSETNRAYVICLG